MFYKMREKIEKINLGDLKSNEQIFLNEMFLFFKT